MHDHVAAVRFQPLGQRRRAEFAGAFMFDDRQDAAQRGGPPRGKRRFPFRQDAATQDRRRALPRGQAGDHGFDPVLGRDRVIVEIGDVSVSGRAGAGVAGDADAGFLDPDQLGAGVVPCQSRELRVRPGLGIAVDDQDREPVLGHGLPTQTVQAIADIVRPVMGADANGEVHATRYRRTVAESLTARGILAGTRKETAAPRMTGAAGICRGTVPRPERRGHGTVPRPE